MQSGIHVKIQIYNNAEYDNYISNPFDTFFVHLWDDDFRKEILLPIAAPRLMIRPAKMSDYSKINVPYAIHTVVLNGKKLTQKEIEAFHFKISPKSTFAFEIELDKQQKYTEAELGYTGGNLTKEQLMKSMETVNLPAGQYRLAVYPFFHAPSFVHKSNEDRRMSSFEPVYLKINLVP